jgi:hypothetical protein
VIVKYSREEKSQLKIDSNKTQPTTQTSKSKWQKPKKPESRIFSIGLWANRSPCDNHYRVCVFPNILLEALLAQQNQYRF